MSDTISAHCFINPSFCRMFDTVAFEFSIPRDMLGSVVAGLAHGIIANLKFRVIDIVRDAATRLGRLLDEAVLHRVTDSVEYLADVLAAHIMNTVDISMLDFLKPVMMTCIFDTIYVKLHMRFSDV